MFDPGNPFRISTSRARERLADIVRHVQDPRAFVVLTRHGKAVAAIVSMPELKRIWEDQDFEDRRDPTRRPPGFLWTGIWAKLNRREAAEEVRRIQLTRWQERRLLESQGMEVVSGGELRAEVPEAALGEAPGTARRGWFRRRRS